MILTIVIPANAGIQKPIGNISGKEIVDSSVRWNDEAV